MFEEIGFEFARYLGECPRDVPVELVPFQRFLDRLRPGDPPAGQRYLRQAFARYERRRLEHDPKGCAELSVLANLEIGLHEQTRLQPEISEALDTACATKEDLGGRISTSGCTPRAPVLRVPLARGALPAAFHARAGGELQPRRRARR